MSVQMKLMDPYLMMINSGVVITGPGAMMERMLRRRAAQMFDSLNRVRISRARTTVREQEDDDPPGPGIVQDAAWSSSGKCAVSV